MTERIEYHVCAYPVRESALMIHEVYGTKADAMARLRIIEDAMRKGLMVTSMIPEIDLVRVVNGSMLVGAMVYTKKVDE